jgi:hypothetical protein
MNPLDRLIAIEDIRTLKARYFRYVDTKDWDSLAAVFAPDACFDRRGAANVRDPWIGGWTPPLPHGADVRSGREAIVRMIRDAVENLRTVHRGYMPEIEILDGATAQAVWAMEDEIRDIEYRLVVRGSGHYHETYVKLATGWAIKTARISRLALVVGAADGGPGRDM